MKNLLAILVDADFHSWQRCKKHKRSNKEGQEENIFTLVSNSLLLFSKAFMAMDEDNLLILIGSTRKLITIYPPSSQPLDNHVGALVKNVKDSVYLPFAEFDAFSSQKLLEMVLQGEEAAGNGCNLAGGLAKLMCYINSTMQKYPSGGLSSSVLVLSVAQDTPNTYVPLMNCIFSAQKMHVPINVCRIGDDIEPSVFLQQASNMTNGIYSTIPDPYDLLQTLLTIHLPDTHTQKLLVLPFSKHVDFRSTCFCHKNIVNIGYICSVCLSIFCGKSSKCSTCGTIFTLE